MHPCAQVKYAGWLAVLGACSLMLVALSNCDSPFLTPEVREGDVYSNSFESPSDTVGWRGNGARELRHDAPAGGRNQSLFVSGGCIVPHATYDFVNGPEDGYLIVQCWGKSIVGGGGVILENVGGANARISLVVGDTVWTAYRSADSLFCPAHQTLRIELDSGGIVYNAMLVDLIRVVRVR